MQKPVFLTRNAVLMYRLDFFLTKKMYFRDSKSTDTKMGKEITFDKFVRGMTAIIIAVLAYLLLNRLSNVLAPFFVAWIVAYMLYPVVCFFQYKCKLKSRSLSIIVTLLLIATVLSIACWFLIPPIIDEVVRLKDIVISYVSSENATSIIPVEVERYLKQNINIKSLSEMISFKDLTSFLEERIPQFISLVSSSVNALIGFICSLIAIIYLFFILMDYEHINRGVLHLVPRKQRKFVKGMILDVEHSMNAYFRGQALIAFLVGILFATGFVIIDFPLAIPLGLFIGVLNLVPYLQGVGIFPAIILALLKAHDTGENFWGIILAVAIVFIVVQAIQDWFLTPRIMGHVTGLNAAVILLSLSIWGSLLGFIGLIIALPLTTLIISYYKRYILREQDEENAILLHKKPIKGDSNE